MRDYSQGLAWLLEPDPSNPGVRYFALRDLLRRSPEDAELSAARQAVMQSGQVPVILAAQNDDGSWSQPEKGSPANYRGTANQIRFLAELGADPQDGRLRRGCEYLLDHFLAANHAFSVVSPPVPSGAVLCLNGNLAHALILLGYAEDERLQATVDWMAHAITGEPPQVKYYKSTNAGPGFLCGVNLGQECAWGAIKALKALSALPEVLRTRSVEMALQRGVEFLLSRDPAVADYPYTERVSSTWFKLGFPLSYWSDVLENLEVLTSLGYGMDSRLLPALELVESKASDLGRWRLENSLNGKMWVDIEAKGQPSKWITLRALRVLIRAGLQLQ